MSLLWLILFLALEPVKRVLSPFLYPLAYALRGSIRGKVALWEPYLYKPVFWPLWLLLDDSLMFSQGKEYDDKEKRYPGWIWRSGSPFLKAWWWAAVRNSFVNFNNWSAHKVGFHVSSIPKTRPATGGFYELHVYDTGAVRPYCEFWVFGRWNQVGWLRGNKESGGASRFEIDLMKKRG